jgi:hypothetical protein
VGPSKRTPENDLPVEFRDPSPNLTKDPAAFRSDSIHATTFDVASLP